MHSLKHALLRARSKFAFPVLASAVTLATIGTGLENSSYITNSSVATPTPAAVVMPFQDTIADSAATSANGLEMDIEHSRIDKWVTRLTTSLKGDFEKSLDRMDKYAAMINKKLDAKQMPRELIYLALIESNFNPTARSQVGAVGLWQFMSSTARQLGLTVKGKIDERKNPAEATDAALTYLGELHDRFGSWYLAAAAYNSGPGTVSKALKKVTGKTQGTDEDFFRILSSLPRETQDYVPKLIATARIGNDPEQYGL